ncbi:MAG: beta-lactamase family protein [Bacteroidetes Order II. Incertae sedis bacterium]|nr:beta-lactamase family protein [Bacteroidetes Order II. bacterium]
MRHTASHLRETFKQIKNMRNKHFYLMLIFLSAFTVLRAQSVKAKMESFTDSLYNEKALNGNILVRDKGSIILQKSYGFSDIENQKRHTVNSTFNIASIAKLFTSTAIMQLEERGKIKVTDPVQKFLPTFPYNNITIKHLLTHTAGLPYIFDEIIRSEKIISNLNNEYILDNLKNRELLREPGTKWEYSNTAYCILALVVEKVTGTKFSEYVKKNIFQKAGMSETYFHGNDYSKIHSYEEDNFFKGKFNRVDTNVFFKLTQGIYGADGVLSTSIDLDKFQYAFFNNKLLKTETVDEILKPTVLNDGNVIKVDGGMTDSYFGLGWFILPDTTNGKIVGHTGGVPGSLSFFFTNSSQKQTVILLDNTHSSRTYSTGENLLEIINNKKPTQYKSSRAQAINYMRLLVGKGTNEAFVYLQKCLEDTITYSKFRDNSINNLAGELMDRTEIKNNLDLAIEALKINIMLFPNSVITHNWYAWALLNAGKKEEAIWVYQKALKMDSNNEEAKSELEKLLKKE